MAFLSKNRIETSYIYGTGMQCLANSGSVVVAFAANNPLLSSHLIISFVDKKLESLNQITHNQVAKSKLIELGVQPDFVLQLNEDGVVDLLKGLLYLREKYCSKDIESFHEP